MHKRNAHSFEMYPALMTFLSGGLSCGLQDCMRCMVEKLIKNHVTHLSPPHLDCFTKCSPILLISKCSLFLFSSLIVVSSCIIGCLCITFALDVCMYMCVRVCISVHVTHKLILLKYSLGLKNTGSPNQLLTLSSFIRRAYNHYFIDSSL